MILDVLDEAGVLGQHEVDGRSLTTVSTGATDPVDVVLLLAWQFVVDDESDLLDIDATSEQVSGDEHSDGTRSELLHDDLTLLLVHLSVEGGHDEVLLGHRLLELVDSALGVAVDDGLLDVEVRVEIEEHLHLPLGLLHSDVILVDTFKSELLVLHEDLGWVSHEVVGELQNVGRQGGREQADLDVRGQELEDLLDLGLEAAREHLIGLIKDEELQVVGLEEASSHHVVDTAWGADNDVLALSEDADVLLDNGSTDASVDLGAQVLTDRVHDESDLHRKLTRGRDDQSLSLVAGRVDALQTTDSEGTSLSSSRLSLKAKRDTVSF